MPGIQDAGHQLLLERVHQLMFRGTSYPEREAFYVVTAARLADKAAQAWESARLSLREFAEHDRLIRLYDGTGDLEDLIITLARLMPYVEALGRSDAMSGADTGSVLALSSQIQAFRNRLVHGDEDIRDGRAGKGFATGTPEVLATGIAIQTRTGGDILRLEYADLADALRHLREWLLVVIQQ